MLKVDIMAPLFIVDDLLERHVKVEERGEMGH